MGELWLGLLRFYTEEFDFREHVVCIRQHARLTTFNKQWTSKYIVIEGQPASRCGRPSVLTPRLHSDSFLLVFCIFPDPFDLNHNLGAGLSRKSAVIHTLLLVDSASFSFFPVYFISHLLPSVTNFIMKAFINGRRVFGTPHKAFPPIYPSLMVSICFLPRTHETRIKPGFFFLRSRSISSTLKFSPRGRWLQTTAAAASVARSATS